jgi:hypothetical protein
MLCSGEMTSSCELQSCANCSSQLRIVRCLQVKSNCEPNSRNDTLRNIAAPRCPLYPCKRTWAAHKVMSAKCQKRTFFCAVGTNNTR